MSDTSPKDAVKAVAWIVKAKEGFTRCIMEREPERNDYDLGETFHPLVHLSALSQVRKQALLEAEQVRLRLAEKYQNGIDTNTADMNGNCDWARLEGAVAVVQALRKLAEE